MSDRVFEQSQPVHVGHLLAQWSRLYRNWKARRAVRKLQDRDDHTLDDIGVTREEVAWAAGLSLTQNAARRLEDVSYRRRKAQQLMWL